MRGPPADPCDADIVWNASLSRWEITFNVTGFSANIAKLYYRLKQIDNDGRFTYSKIVLLLLSKSNSIAIYPNPASDIVTLSFSNLTLLHTTAIITDMHGKQVKKFTISNYQEQVDISNLPKGMYILILADGTATRINKN